jgi:hypothetical protein
MTAPRAIHQLVIEMPAIDVFRLNHSMTVLPVRPTQLAASFISNQAGGEPPPHARHRALTLSGPALLSKHDSTPPSDCFDYATAQTDGLPEWVMVRQDGPHAPWLAFGFLQASPFAWGAGTGCNQVTV